MSLLACKFPASVMNALPFGTLNNQKKFKKLSENGIYYLNVLKFPFQLSI